MEVNENYHTIESNVDFRVADLLGWGRDRDCM